MQLKLRFRHETYSDEHLNRVLEDILEANTLCSMATQKGGDSYINTAYYCFNEGLDLFFLSDPESQHSVNLTANASIALSIFDSHQPWDLNKKGLQLFGTAELATGLTLLEAGRLYMQRFSGLKKWIANLDDLAKNIIKSKFYIVRIHSLKMFDEDVLGKEVFLTLRPEKA